MKKPHQFFSNLYTVSTVRIYLKTQKVGLQRRRTRLRDRMKPKFNSIFIARDIGYIVNH